MRKTGIVGLEGRKKKVRPGSYEEACAREAHMCDLSDVHEAPAFRGWSACAQSSQLVADIHFTSIEIQQHRWPLSCRRDGTAFLEYLRATPRERDGKGICENILLFVHRRTGEVLQKELLVFQDLLPA